MKANSDLSIVVPAYNEARRIGSLLNDIASFATSFDGSYEIILADDGSTDDTIAVAQQNAAALGLADNLHILPSPQNRGKGNAVRRGILHSRGRLVLFCDADGATPMKEFFKLKKHIERGFDVAIGSRALPEANLVVPQPIHRRFMGAAMRFLVWHLVVPGYRDTQCGFKLFTAAAGRQIFARQVIDGFSFDVEVLFLARQLGLKVAEVPVEWHDQPGSKVDPFRAPPAMMRELFLIRWRHRQVATASKPESQAVR